ncbi:MAG: hypothetical protein WC582_00140 [Patescibacteria group bacterium]|jgi:hypothetical protein
MNRKDLVNHYTEATLASLEPGRTIHVLSEAPGTTGEKDIVQLTEILVIANPAVSDGKVRYRRCQNGTPGKEIFEIDVDIFMGKIPNPEGKLFRIPK